jgi:hypothetical protein
VAVRAPASFLGFQAARVAASDARAIGATILLAGAPVDFFTIARKSCQDADERSIFDRCSGFCFSGSKRL